MCVCGMYITGEREGVSRKILRLEEMKVKDKKIVNRKNISNFFE